MLSFLFFLMFVRPRIFTRTDTLFPYPTRFLSPRPVAGPLLRPRCLRRRRPDRRPRLRSPTPPEPEPLPSPNPRLSGPQRPPPPEPPDTSTAAAQAYPARSEPAGGAGGDRKRVDSGQSV